MGVLEGGDMIKSGEAGIQTSVERDSSEVSRASRGFLATGIHYGAARRLRGSHTELFTQESPGKSK